MPLFLSLTSAFFRMHDVKLLVFNGYDFIVIIYGYAFVCLMIC
jgi:hypothetical protein